MAKITHEDILAFLEEATILELNDLVSAIEEKFGGMAYCAIRSYTEFGTLDSFLWVSPYKEDWKYDDEDIPDGYVFSWVRNRDAEFCSEFGTIYVKPTIAGGLKRIG